MGWRVGRSVGRCAELAWQPGHRKPGGVHGGPPKVWVARRQLHGSANNPRSVNLGLFPFDNDVVEEPPARPQHLLYGLAKEAVVMLLQPFVVEAARKLHRQLRFVVLLIQSNRSEGLKPRSKTLAADVVSDDVETLVPDRIGGAVHGLVTGAKRCKEVWRGDAPSPEATIGRRRLFTTLSTFLCGVLDEEG